MGIRETLNKNPSITTGATIGIILIALTFIVYSTFFSGPRAPKPITKAYYSIDNGATYFVDDINKIVPYDYNGSPAVRCRVFSCDGGTTKWVGYLERYPAKVAKMLNDQAASAGSGGAGAPPMMMEMDEQMECKKPGGTDKDWVAEMTHQDLVVPKCPDGGTGPVIECFPDN